MASNDESNTGQYPLLIIYEDDTDDRRLEERNNHSRTRGGSRNGPGSSARGRSAHRGWARDQSATNQSGLEDSRDDIVGTSGRGRGRGSHRRPQSGRTRGRARGISQSSTYHPDLEDNGDEVGNSSEKGRGKTEHRRPHRGRTVGPRGRGAEQLYVQSGRTNKDDGFNGKTWHHNSNNDGKDTKRRRQYHISTHHDEGSCRPFRKGVRVQKLSERKLIELSKSKDDPDELLFEIDKMSTGFINILTKPLDPNLVYYVIRILSIVSRSTQTAHLRDILKEVDSHMLHHLTELLCEVSMKDHNCESLWNVPNTVEKLLLNSIAMTKAVMTILSPSLGKCMNLISTIRKVKESLSVDNIESELIGIETLFETVKTNRELREKKPKQVPRHREDATEPPNSFREIPIFPELSDLQMDERPFLRANKVRGKYDNLDTYLDVQFRLLREDYIQPLRKGITEYRDCVKTGGNVRRIRELKLYNAVQIMYPVCSGRGINHVIQFDTNPFKTMKWASSRRLLHGSLLCLSNDNFDTILYATVTGRDESQLKDGKLEVHFENVDDLLDKKRNEMFIMAETSAYFEAYRFILEGLQEIESKMPFEGYLVNCDNLVKPPKYLLRAGGPQYDFTSLLLAKEGINVFPVLNTRQWPKAIDLGLDASQYEALQRAITKELAIIQGPPGTGKTFVGLKIAQLLLDNQKFWKKDDSLEQSLFDGKRMQNKIKGSPILVVCYTNHALDQFLEGLLAIGKTNIIRIGGRCKNESIEPYILRKVKEQKREMKGFSRLSENDAQCKRMLRECEEAIELISSLMKRSETKILTYRVLSQYMTEAQQDAFESSHTEDELKTCFFQWLSVSQPKADETDLSLEDQIHLTWQEYIVKEVSPMQDNERQCVESILSLEPIQRAELYKAWVVEFISSVNSLMQQNLSGKEQSIDKDEMSRYISSSENSILEARVLVKYLHRPETRKQLMLLLDKSGHKSNNPIQHWLCSSIPTSKIKSALEENIDRYKNITEGEETVDTKDMEEERELDEEDAYVPELKQKAKETKKPVATDNGEWISKWKERTQSKNIRQMITGARYLTNQEAEKMTHVWDLSLPNRRNLYAYWVQHYRLHLKNDVKEYEKKFNDATEKLQEVRNMETVEILKDSEIIGMTTTGAAKQRKILQIVRPKIIIVEEAAEVLESHIVTTLNNNCEHLILIGDHKQLRPSTTVYALAKKYHMDISLFERMVCNNVPCITLEEQHRMRPEISVLLTHENLYPKLRNHPNVYKYDDMKGVVKNFQFITHEVEEVSSTESTSYSNQHEAKYLAKLCRYLLNQGYQRDQISVITPYMGQVLLLRKEMPKSDYEGVRITAVDNFQGEENDIILLSLVRSRSIENMAQKRNPIGFVGIENRICVSLSRAKMGFYVIGNFRLLENYSEMWAKMITLMKQNKLVREGIRLRCQNHPDSVTFAQTAEDFKAVPEGGCSRSCNTQLECGHVCPLYCHPIDRDHEYFKCLKPCEKIICSYGHQCKKHCHETCGECTTMVIKEVPMCGHTASMACHIDPFTWKCRKICDFPLPCGHKCGRKCSQCTEGRDHEEECKVEVKRTLECGHEASMKCYTDPAEYDCQITCLAKLDCGHKCSGNCGKCFSGRIHYGCNGTCGKVLPCGHKCSYPCSEFCPPCGKRCEFSCSHGLQCNKLCYEKCKDCFGPCKFSCDKHRIRCSLPCNDLCDMQPCSEACNKKLACKEDHGSCKGICGEKCFCIICQNEKLRLDPGEKVDKDSLFIQLPNCYCILEIGKFTRFINKHTGDERLYKTCPHCGVAITKHIRLFTNVLKTAKEKIVQEYEMLVGSFDERKTKLTKLKRTFNNFTERGIPRKDIDIVINRLRSDNFGAFRYASDLKGRLITLLEINNFMERSRSSVRTKVEHTEGIVKISKLRDMLLRGRRFVTKQFWNDVDREIGRIGIWARFYVLNEHLEGEGNVDLKTAALITKVFQTISRKQFSQTDEESLSDVYKRIASLLRTGSSVDNEKIKVMLDECVKDLEEKEQENISTDIKPLEINYGTPV